MISFNLHKNTYLFTKIIKKKTRTYLMLNKLSGT